MTDTQLLPTRAVRARYGDKSAKTIDRWEAAGILPPPVRINSQRYWYLHDLEAMERASMLASSEETV